MNDFKMTERTVIGFWKAGKPYGFMSQWYYSDFTDDGIKFNTCEVSSHRKINIKEYI